MPGEAKPSGLCRQNHRHQRRPRFLRIFDQTVPARKVTYPIGDNHSTHKHDRFHIRQFLKLKGCHEAGRTCVRREQERLRGEVHTIRLRLISADPDLKGVHMIVGLSNFAWGTPRAFRKELEKAYLTLGAEVGLDFAIANPETISGPLPEDHPMVAKLRDALEQGRPREGETNEIGGYRQVEAVMALCSEVEAVDY